MASLPDELWMYILQCGTGENFGHRDLCTISIVSRRFRRLCLTDRLWKDLWNKDWPSSFALEGSKQGSSKLPKKIGKALNQGIAKQHVFDNEGQEQIDVVGPGRNQKNGKKSKTIESTKCIQLEVSKEGVVGSCCGSNSSRNVSWKEKYRIRYERERNARAAAHCRQVLRAKSRVAILENDIRALEHKLAEELKNLRTAAALAKVVDRSRQAKMALKVWQPSVATRWQQQLVEQMPSSEVAQIETVRQEMAVAREGIQRYKKSLVRISVDFCVNLRPLVAINGALLVICRGCPARRQSHFVPSVRSHCSFENRRRPSRKHELSYE